MSSQLIRWTSLVIVTVGFVGCDSNPSGPAAPTVAPANAASTGNVPTEQGKPVKTKVGSRAGNAPQVAD